MSKNIIYYFSGTGNSLNVAIEIAKELKNTRVIPMRGDPQEVPALDADIIGFTFPVHHWCLPKHAKEFIEKLEINNKAYIFAVATSGGLPVNVLVDFKKIIAKKGAKVSYSKAHITMSSYVAVYEPYLEKKRTLAGVREDLKEIVKEVSQKICNKEPKKTIGKEFLRLFEKYLTGSLYEQDKNFNVNEDCNSCKLCERICMSHNIEMKNGIPEFKHDCSQCMSCIVFCPKYSINYGDKTQNRTKYHHPNITANQMLADYLDF
ncbi:4Fe-4S ferredoxin iron-sulfur binding domain-containing protein [Desulfonispora thiosulfatigenes DSM 11270]|uniref:4Fe-4S ferredoxin iron-sulfur binding domain-containing protein n=1 Tax=Desulfonispora thiosulfatigenes DSM 11270 TaxID=656914 RepID=A0A1W1VSL3_DESTI|nr:EFR1 family ferrodoxin [Desulfonispora thiosulfatigenes]SMB96326.1 4Fe-4S ferredoxin iron-sulfur binding domain-containing protein [Desulfonispora thiosulfatigenes DSM 11270]